MRSMMRLTASSGIKADRGAENGSGARTTGRATGEIPGPKAGRRVKRSGCEGLWVRFGLKKEAIAWLHHLLSVPRK